MFFPRKPFQLKLTFVTCILKVDHLNGAIPGRLWTLLASLLTLRLLPECSTIKVLLSKVGSWLHPQIE